MTKVEYAGSAYQIMIYDIVQGRQLSIKFDTGAAVTIISLATLVGKKEATAELAQRITQWAQGRAKSKTYMSASNGKVEAFPVVVNHEVSIGDIVIPEGFRYWLAPSLVEVKNDGTIVPIRKALLGDDFIRYCNFTHEVNGPIWILDFDKEGYQNDKSSTGIESLSHADILDAIHDRETNSIESSAGTTSNLCGIAEKFEFIGKVDTETVKIRRVQNGKIYTLSKEAAIKAIENNNIDIDGYHVMKRDNKKYLRKNPI